MSLSAAQDFYFKALGLPRNVCLLCQNKRILFLKCSYFPTVRGIPKKKAINFFTWNPCDFRWLRWATTLRKVILLRETFLWLSSRLRVQWSRRRAVNSVVMFQNSFLDYLHAKSDHLHRSFAMTILSTGPSRPGEMQYTKSYHDVVRNIPNVTLMGFFALLADHIPFSVLVYQER